MRFRKFLPIRKVEEQSDGTLLVWGMATAQRPDLDNEVMDYLTTKPEYQKTATATFAKTSAVDGVDTSLFPVREMHQLIAAGCGKSMEFDDSSKEINIGVHVVDASSCKKVKAGVLIGFSHAGDYIKTWKDPEFAGCVRYTASLAEISLVDSPCLPDALIAEVAQKSFQMLDKNGSVRMVKFQATPRALANLSDTDIDRIANTLAKSLRAQPKVDEARKARWAKAITEKFGSEKEAVAQVTKALTLVASPKPLAKGMYAVSQFGQCLECLSWLQAMAVAEKEYEGDESTQPTDYAELLAHAIDVFRDVVAEETGELAAQAAILSGKGAATVKVKILSADEVKKSSEKDLRAAYLELSGEVAQIEAMEKAAKGVVAHLTEMHKAASDHCATMVKAAGDHMTAMHGSIAKCMKAAGGEGAAADTSGNDGKEEKDEEAKKAAKAIDDAKALLTKAGLTIVPPASGDATLTLTAAELDDKIAKAIKATEGNRTRVTLVPRQSDVDLAKAHAASGDNQLQETGF